MTNTALIHLVVRNDEFGNSLGSWGNVGNHYLYTGQEYDGSITQLYNLRARYYKPSIGRFFSEDLIELMNPDLEVTSPQSKNLYQYVKNNSVNLIDPLDSQGRMITGNYELPSIYELYCGIALFQLFWHKFTAAGGKWDKYFHCLVSCRLMEDCNWTPNFTRFVGNLRERVGIRDPEDVVANEKGIECASRPCASCEKCCRESYPWPR